MLFFDELKYNMTRFKDVSPWMPSCLSYHISWDIVQRKPSTRALRSLFQVIQEMNQAGQNSGAFSRLFLDREGQDLLKFSNSVFEMMNHFSQAIFRVGLDALPGNLLGPLWWFIGKHWRLIN